jgi:hypothetical protein
MMSRIAETINHPRGGLKTPQRGVDARAARRRRSPARVMTRRLFSLQSMVLESAAMLFPMLFNCAVRVGTFGVCSFLTRGELRGIPQQL